nr:HK97-gp10 family putative phage morphogenesis protein [Paenisporosarcina cavernae]
MAKSGKVSFGHKALERALKRYGEDILEEVRRIIIETASIIRARAKLLAPVDDGNLRDSIEMEISSDGLSAVVKVTAHYAVYVEFGTGIYAVEGNGRKTPWTYYSEKLGRFVVTSGMRAQPYWFPAIDEGQRYFRSEMRKLGR